MILAVFYHPLYFSFLFASFPEPGIILELCWVRGRSSSVRGMNGHWVYFANLLLKCGRDLFVR
jgi:hypothetical protein